MIDYEALIPSLSNQNIAEFVTWYDNFLHSQEWNKWFNGEVFKIYIRKGVHLIDGKTRKCLDIAAIGVTEKYRNKGWGNYIIEMIHANNPYAITYIENVHNMRWADKLSREGWLRTGYLLHDVCFYKIVGKKYDVS